MIVVLSMSILSLHLIEELVTYKCFERIHHGQHGWAKHDQKE